jgi:GYF domain 2
MSALGSRWYWIHRGKQAGPIAWGELQSLAKSGKLRPTDLVLREGSQTWQPANTAKNIEDQPAITMPAAANPPSRPSFAAMTEAEPDSDESIPAGPGLNLGRMLFGVLLCGGGIIGTMANYDAAVAKGGGHYIMYTGPVIWGLVLLFQSFGGAANER